MIDMNRHRRAQEALAARVYPVPSDRMMMYIIGCQVRPFNYHAGLIIDERPANDAPDAFDKAVESLKRVRGEAELSDETLAGLILLGTVQAVEALERDPEQAHLRMPERFRGLGPVAMGLAFGYYELPALAAAE